MRKLLLSIAICLCSVAVAEEIVLDISKENIKYGENGVWTGVFENSMIFTSEFMISHAAPYPNYSNGFFPSKVSTIQGTATIDDQWGCMAKGGYSGEGTPFLGAYWDSYNDSANSRVCMIYNMYTYYAVGMYVCNNPYTYYSVLEGNGFAKKFEKGDWLKLNIHAKDLGNRDLEPIEVYLADYRSENPEEWTINNSWEWIDLRRFGKVSAFYFTMESSDTGEYGMNTPAYFCIDRLTLSSEDPSGIDAIETQATVYYNRAVNQLQIVTEQPVEVALYGIDGAELMRQTVESNTAWDMSNYPTGVYVVRCGNRTIKVIK